MQVTTIRNRPKPFAWSYSKLKNFESCPKRHYEVDIRKSVREEESEQLAFGNQLHKALATRLDKKTPLPTPYAEYEGWCAKLEATPGVIIVEQQLAITRDLKPTEWFGKDAWYRGIADVVKWAPGGKVGVVWDWKTGKIVEDSVQLALMAQCVFSHVRSIEKLRTEFIWLKEDATTRADFTRSDMVKVWNALEPRIAALEHAHNTTTYPAVPGNLCRRWCPVTECPHHGK